MAVSIIPKFSKKDIEKALAERRERIEKALILRLQRVGERFIKNARENGSYNDITGNLRSSIGYVILKNGEQLFQAGFVKVKNGDQGPGVGKKVIGEAKQKFHSGLVLICVAGMNYAAVVESKGKDVITGSSLIAEDDLKKSLKEISKKVGLL